MKYESIDVKKLSIDSIMLILHVDSPANGSLEHVGHMALLAMIKKRLYVRGPIDCMCDVYHARLSHGS